MMWRNFRKSLSFPTSNEVGALSTVIKELKEKTEKALGHTICEAAAAVPHFPAIYDEDLYDAFEYAGLNYL
jgi:Ethanolamine utilization protein EutJ (predicted chaperonin)